MAHQPVPPSRNAWALLDTGAETTCVDTILVQHLGLPLAHVTLANVPALGGLQAGAHFHAGVALVHPSGNPRLNLEVANLLILEMQLGAIGYQILVGRDILDRCDFLYSGRRKRFRLTY